MSFSVPVFSRSRSQISHGSWPLVAFCSSFCSYSVTTDRTHGRSLCTSTTTSTSAWWLYCPSPTGISRRPSWWKDHSKSGLMISAENFLRHTGAQFHGSAYQKQRISAHESRELCAYTASVCHKLAGKFCLCLCVLNVTRLSTVTRLLVV